MRTTHEGEAVARISIYVSDDLKASMDALTTINWSSVAQGAFEQELRLHPQWTEYEMNAVIERLRASKKKQVDNLINDGFEAGKGWAERDAEYLELKNIAKIPTSDDMDDYEDDSEDPFETGPSSVSYRDALPDYNFWTKEIPLEYLKGNSDMPHLYFRIGFVKGAKSVWRQVSDKL
jgi:hypothetical protein